MLKNEEQTACEPEPEPESARLGEDPKLAQLHRVLLMMLGDFAALCEREGLRWYVSYGSAIGALRHGGFVPWDEDLDICMPRADLDRLVAAVQDDSAVAERYEVVNATLNRHYPLATTRLMLRGTEFRDSALATMDFASGIFLDLFPLDALPDDERAFRRQAWRAWLLNKLAIAQGTRRAYVAGTGAAAGVMRLAARAAYVLLNAPGLRSVDFNARSLAWQTRYNAAAQDASTRRVGYLCDTNRFWDVYDRDDLEPARRVAFEGMVVPIPHRAEKLLEALYGDFMTPPPESERHGHYPDVLDFGPYANI